MTIRKETKSDVIFEEIDNLLPCFSVSCDGIEWAKITQHLGHWTLEAGNFPIPMRIVHEISAFVKEMEKE